MKKSYSVKLEGNEWKDCLKESYNKKKKDIKMDGFRKGLVPYEIYTKKVGVESLYMDAMDLAVDKLYAKLLSDPETITPAATPSIDIKNITEHEVEVEFNSYNSSSGIYSITASSPVVEDINLFIADLMSMDIFENVNYTGYEISAGGTNWQINVVCTLAARAADDSTSDKEVN